jgi:hypothetical protein
MLIAFDPTRTPRIMKMVAGFQVFDRGSLGRPSRLNALGTMERHSEGFATRGRCEVSFCRKLDVAKVLRDAEDCRTHCEQALSVC